MVDESRPAEAADGADGPQIARVICMTSFAACAGGADGEGRQRDGVPPPDRQRDSSALPAGPRPDAPPQPAPCTAPGQKWLLRCAIRAPPFGWCQPTVATPTERQADRTGARLTRRPFLPGPQPRRCRSRCCDSGSGPCSTAPRSTRCPRRPSRQPGSADRPSRGQRATRRRRARDGEGAGPELVRRCPRPAAVFAFRPRPAPAGAGARAGGRGRR